MKIFGVGTDIVNTERFNKSFKLYTRNFKKKIFTISEIAYCDKKKNNVAAYAKRFAAKEAFTKALGTGFRKGITFKNISVINDKNGKPSIKLSGKVKRYLKKKIKSNKYSIHLSLSDDRPWAQATVIISYN